jgi:hypothetical protein
MKKFLAIVIAIAMMLSLTAGFTGKVRAQSLYMQFTPIEAGLTTSIGTPPASYNYLKGGVFGGVILATNNVPTDEYWLKFSDNNGGTFVSELPSSEMFGLYLHANSTQQSTLLAYYDARKSAGLLPDNYYNYLVAATNGTEPFAYLDFDLSSTTGVYPCSLIDGARYSVGGNKVPMAIPGDFPEGTYRVAPPESEIGTSGGTLYNIQVTLIVERFSLSITGCQAGLTTTIGTPPSSYSDLSGDVSSGYTLIANNVATNEYWLKFKSGTATNSFLTSDSMYPMYLVSATVSAPELQAYYAARGIPSNYLDYLNAAAEGTEPFVYIGGDITSPSTLTTTTCLYDGARYVIGGNKVPMAVPGDFPEGTYTVQGTITDVLGNNLQVTLTLNVARSSYTITANTGAHGSISPSGDVTVNYGTSQSFTITPDTGYHVADVLVDGLSVGPVTSYNFPSVTATHTISATFAINTYTITTYAGAHGSISPSGDITVNYGGSQTFTITPDPGYHIDGLNVDGFSLAPASTYTFTNVADNSFISADFAIDTFTITTSAGPNGSITPSGTVSANYGDSKSFEITADPDFMISQVIVDGSPVKLSGLTETSFTFNNISSDHTISAKFIEIPEDNSPPEITLPGLNSPVIVNSDSFTFTVSVTSGSGAIVRMVIKVNGVVVVDKNNLDPTIPLSEGVNNVDVTVYNSTGASTTKSFEVISDTKPPLIDLDVPATTTSSSLELSGKIIDKTTGVKYILVNGIEFSLSESGELSTTLTLNAGNNVIEVKASDNAGNVITKTYNVEYVPVSQSSITISLQINNPYITVNGISKKIDSQSSKPIIEDSRTLLPIRALIESLGGTIQWDASDRKVTISLNGHSIVLWIGKTTTLVDGSNATLDVAPEIINGRTYLPLRFISENLGASVDWYTPTQTITIYYWP